MVTIELRSYGSAEPLALRLPSNCTCETALKEVAKVLYLKEESLNAFALFCGKLDCPMKVLQPSDSIPSSTELSLQRWCMQTDEGKIVRHDDVALHLLYCQAKAKIERGDMKPSAEQLEKLASFSDPFFPTERQYLEVARSVPGYSTVVARDCIVAEAIEDNEFKFEIGSRVRVSMDLEGLSVTSETTDSQKLHWPWTVVRRWKRMSSKHSTTIKFEVYMQLAKSPSKYSYVFVISCVFMKCVYVYTTGLFAQAQCWSAVLD